MDTLYKADSSTCPIFPVFRFLFPHSVWKNTCIQRTPIRNLYQTGTVKRNNVDQSFQPSSQGLFPILSAVKIGTRPWERGCSHLSLPTNWAVRIEMQYFIIQLCFYRTCYCYWISLLWEFSLFFGVLFTFNESLLAPSQLAT